MKLLKLSRWTICVESSYKTVQQDNTMVVLDNKKNFVALISIDEKSDMIIEKCSTRCQCEVNYEHKKVLLEVVE